MRFILIGLILIAGCAPAPVVNPPYRKVCMEGGCIEITIKK